MSTLTGYIALFDDQGTLVQFSPGDDPPGWARKRITNPDLWDTPPAQADDPVPSTAATSGGGDEPPPLAGPGSGRDHWAAYAVRHGVTVSEDDKRDAIVDALRKAGVPVE